MNLKDFKFPATVTRVTDDLVYASYYNNKSKKNSEVEIVLDKKDNVKQGDYIQVVQSLNVETEWKENLGTIGTVEAINNGYVILSNLLDKYSSKPIPKEVAKELLPVKLFNFQVKVGSKLMIHTQTSYKKRR